MKKFLLWMLAITFMGGLAMAQGNQRGGEKMDPKVRAERMTERMVKDYSLDDTQKQQLQKVNLEWVQKMAENQTGRGKTKEMSKEDREKLQKEMKESRETYENELKKILTKEQYDTYTKNQAERRSKMSNRARN